METGRRWVGCRVYEVCVERFLELVRRPAGLLALVMGCIAVWAITNYAQVERVQGPIQKIMYVHVPSAMASYLAFVVVAVSGALYLWRGERHWDRLARCSAELGVIFCSMVLVTGPMWGKPVWGVWWSWDARLTSTLLLWLIYVAYFVLRRMSTGEQGARFAAVLGVVGVLDIPFINMAAEKFQTLHPPNLIKSGGMTFEMKVTLVLCAGAVVVFYVYLLARRVSLEQLSDRVLELESGLDGG